MLEFCATGICWEGLSPHHRHGNYFRSSRKELSHQCTSQTQDRELPLSTPSSRAGGDSRLLNQLCCWQHDSAACHCRHMAEPCQVGMQDTLQAYSGSQELFWSVIFHSNLAQRACSESTDSNGTCTMKTSPEWGWSMLFSWYSFCYLKYLEPERGLHMN